MVINPSFKPKDYLKITVLGFALTALWQSLHSIVLPQRLLDIVPEAQKNTFLGILTFVGLALAMFIQPIAGGLSDRSRAKWGRRRPYIMAGGLTAVILIPGIGWATGFTVLFIVYCLLQIVTNTAQGPYQAFIPEYVPAEKHGHASGLKALMEVAGGAIFVMVASVFMDRYYVADNIKWFWGILALLMVVMAAAVAVTLFSVKETPVYHTIHRLSFSKKISQEAREILVNPVMMWFLITRLLIYMGFTTIQQFALYFLKDDIGVENPAEATARFLIYAVAGMLIIVWPAGYFSDKLGKKPISIGAGLLGAIGILLIIISRDYNTILWSAGIIGMAMGAFNSANWALAIDLAAPGEEARYLGIANIATAGGAALARAIGPGIDYFNGRHALLGYDLMLWICVVYFTAGALLMLSIRLRVKQTMGRGAFHNGQDKQR